MAEEARTIILHIKGAIQYAAEAAVTAVWRRFEIVLDDPVLGPLLVAAIRRWLGHNRDDQRDPDITPGSQRVSLHCLTDERFLEVLADYESTKMKESLEEELEKVGFKVKELDIKIENINEVKETTKAITKRNSYPTEVMMARKEKRRKRTDSSRSRVTTKRKRTDSPGVESKRRRTDSPEAKTKRKKTDSSSQSNQDELAKGVQAMRVEKQAEVGAAEVQEVKYYLMLVHDLTMKSYCKNGYKESLEALKKEEHNIQNVLKICSQMYDPATSDISDCLANSKIYTTSARYFSLFVRLVIPSSIVDEFLQRCADIAESKQQHAIKINFDLLLADQELTKSINQPHPVDLDAKMKKIQDEFKMHEKDINKDESLCAEYYYQWGRYTMQQSEQSKRDRKNLENQARDQLMKSLELRRNLMEPIVSLKLRRKLMEPEESLESTLQMEPEKSSESVADTVYSLIEVGRTFKTFTDRNEKEAKKYYNEAIKLSRKYLGKHELTACTNKNLGDLFLATTDKEARKKCKVEEAEKEYKVAKKMLENLGLRDAVRYVSVLNNLGRCLIEKEQAEKAIEILESAREIAEDKPVESHLAKVYKIKVYAALATAYDSKEDKSNAKKYATEAIEFEKIPRPKKS